MEKKVNNLVDEIFGTNEELLKEIFGEVEEINVYELSLEEIEVISKQNELIALSLIDLIIGLLNNRKIPRDIKEFIYGRIETISKESEKISKGA